MSDARGPRFLTLTDVAEILNTSLAQVSALVKREELRAIKLGGRGQWRVEVSELEAFIQRMYDETHAHLEQQRRAGRQVPDQAAADEVGTPVLDGADEPA